MEWRGGQRSHPVRSWCGSAWRAVWGDSLTDLLSLYRAVPIQRKQVAFRDTDEKAGTWGEIKGWKIPVQYQRNSLLEISMVGKNAKGGELIMGGTRQSRAWCHKDNLSSICALSWRCHFLCTEKSLAFLRRVKGVIYQIKQGSRCPWGADLSSSSCSPELHIFLKQ